MNLQKTFFLSFLSICLLCNHSTDSQPIEFKTTPSQTPAYDYRYFGVSIDLSDNQIVVGSTGDATYDVHKRHGSIYVFEWTGSGVNEEQKIRPWDGTNYQLGSSVAIDKNTILMGAASSGQVLFYHKNQELNHSWRLKQITTGETTVYGNCIDIEKETAVIAECSGSIGKVYVYEYQDERVWVEEAVLSENDDLGPHNHNYFGQSVSISGNTIIVGAPGSDDMGSNSGAAYIFTKINGTWVQSQKIVASDGSQDDNFGRSVAISNNTAIVGAYRSNNDRGSAYIFTRYQSAWVLSAKLEAVDGVGRSQSATSADQFGISVAIDGNTVVVGADNDDGGMGGVYVFQKIEDAWIQIHKLTASDPGEYDYFGRSVSIADGLVAVGSSQDDDQGRDAGSAYIYSLTELTNQFNQSGGKNTERIYINEIMYNPYFPSLGADDEFCQYIELLNESQQQVNLDGYHLQVGTLDYSLPTGIVLNPGQHVVFPRKSDYFALESTYGVRSNAFGSFNDALPSLGQISLVKADGTIMDQATYGNAAPYPTEPNGTGPSLELISPSLDNQAADSWLSSSGKGTPGAVNSVSPQISVSTQYLNLGQLHMANLSPQQITLQNPASTGDLSVNLVSSHFNVTFDQSNITLAAGGSEVITVNVLPTSIQPLQGQLTLTTNVPGQQQILIEFNSQSVQNTVIISELMYHPLNGGEYVELYNQAGFDIDLTGWHIEGLGFSPESGTTIAAQDYLVIAKDPNTIQTDYSITNVIGSYPSILLDGGVTISLRNSQAILVDTVSYQAKSPWPIKPDGQGASLALLDPNLDNSLASSWVGQTPSPGLPNTGEVVDAGSSQEIESGLSGSTSTYTLDLVTGLNMISLPNQPETTYTAKTFCQKIGSASLLIRYDSANQAFEAYIPSQDADNGFTIGGGQGYIVNLTEDRQVAFSGVAWSDVSTAPVSNISVLSNQSSTEAWAFVVQAELPPELQQFSDLSIRLTYQQGTLIQPINGSQIRLPLVDQMRRAVVSPDSRLQLDILNPAGQRVGSRLIQLSSEHLSQAYALEQVEYRHIPGMSRLLQNYPNPFNPETWIPFQLHQSSEVNLTIFASDGRVVREMELGLKEAGVYQDIDSAIYWDGRTESGEKVSSGTYFYQIMAGDYVQTRKMVILK